MFAIPFIVYAILATRANIDLASGRYALFMDERITFDGVRAILQPTSAESFFFAITDGGDNRYGRILWTAMAFFSWLPELIFGESGQIIAGRLWQVTLLASSVALLAIGFLRKWASRTLFASVALFIPFSAYYSTMPKPEPIQILFLSLFVYFGFRKQGQIFGKHWIFAGLAFGAKIATLPALVVFLAAGLFLNNQHDKPKKFHISLLAAILGLGLAVPLLLPAAITICLLGWAYLAFDKKGKFGVPNYLITDAILISVILLIFKGNTDIWIQSTFQSTGHGSDQASINFVSWVNFFIQEWISSTPALSILFILLTALLFIVPFVKSDLKKIEFLKLNIAPISMFIAGTGLNLSIMVSAQRLWGFYLYPGFFLQMIAMAVMFERTITLTRLEEKRRPIFEWSIVYAAVVTTFALLISSWAPAALREYSAASTRTSTNEFKAQNESYMALEKFMDEYSENANRRITAVVSPSIFHRESDEKFEVIEFWGPYSYWDSATDLLVLSKNNLPGSTPYPSDSPEYERYLQEQAGYPLHVSTDGVCEKAPCFRPALVLANGAEVLVRTK